MMTLGVVLDQATTALATAGVDAPRREATKLWAHVAQRSTADVLLDRDALVADDMATRYLAAVARRAAGEPLAYVTGWTGFRNLTLACDPRALIPRPETEGLIEAALARGASGLAADVCTGTGAIALSLRDEGNFAAVIGCDISTEALALARENGRRTGLDVEWIAGDLVTPLRGREVNLLVANPPYLTADEYRKLDASVRDHEPMLALVSGDDGLDATRRLLDEGRYVVAAGGWIALELDCRRADASAALAGSLGWSEIAVQDDLFGRARYLLARRESTR
jgi:release factor glutamine methyltransferase